MVRGMHRYLSTLASLAGLLSATGVSAQEGDAFVRLRAADERLLAIAAPMMQANARLCDRTMPVSGLSLHSSDQYTAAPESWFANGDVTIAAVAPGSPADRAGLLPDDAIIEIAGTPVSGLVQQDGSPRRDAVFAALAAQTGPSIPLTIARGGEERRIVVEAQQVCSVLIEVLTGEDGAARSDGQVIQIGQELAARLTDEQLATVFAHELAHVVLRHRIRLETAGVSKGLAGELGRNQRLNRQVEVEADQLSVHLLANAGYDPQVAPQFWRSDEGRRLDAGLLRSWTYPSASSRAEILETEISLYLPLGRGTTWPGHLLDRRERPFAQAGRD